MSSKGLSNRIKLSSYDDMFSAENDGNTTAEAKPVEGQIVEIPLSELHTFENHPFRVVDDENMEEMVESVKEYGVLVPAIARPRAEGGYELISGHRRKHASELAGKDTMPVIVRDCDNDEAVVIMVDANIQREDILVSERAKAYQMKYEAMKHQGKAQGNSLQEMSEQAGESMKTIASWGKESEMNEKLADPANKGNFKMVDPRDIQPFREHTFQVRDDEEMKELRDSIRANGILQPLLVYWNEEWELEMISGHRRRQAAIDLRLKEVPVIVMHVNRETATLLMGESNLRTREKLLPSEKGFTYKAMMEALRKKPGVRLDAGFRDRTRELLAKNLGQSGRQIQKYINITKLIPELLKLVDEGRIGICPADVMSRLPEYVQKLILEYYRENDVTPNHGQVIKMVEMQKEKPLTKEAVYELLAEPKGNQIYIDPHLFFRSRVVAAMLKDCTTSAEMERRAIFAIQLLNWYEKYLIKNGTDPRRVDFVIRDIMNQDVE